MNFVQSMMGWCGGGMLLGGILGILLIVICVLVIVKLIK